MARVKQQRPPDFLAPAGQQEILDRLAELRLAREAIGPGAGKVYLADVHAFADRVFADLEAEAARKKGFRLAELRALLTLELESGQDVVTLEHVDGLDPAEVHAVVDQRAPDGYTDAISERVTADDDEAAGRSRRRSSSSNGATRSSRRERRGPSQTGGSPNWHRGRFAPPVSALWST